MPKEEEIITKTGKYCQMDENENTTYQNVWSASKEVFRAFPLIAASIHIKKQRGWRSGSSGRVPAQLA
jgi:hypothetical protein